jgi:hypothetical protein
MTELPHVLPGDPHNVELNDDVFIPQDCVELTVERPNV